ncbi:MAG: GGDEF domain-containing protein [Lachnospiraceae bacterium]|nr:GGDEF domain-containing protein [Lachnospiraceae bacterium]
MEMTENLFDNIINTASDCVFWKDKKRRFVGVNQAFLDFYGFESSDVLIGKTDEDMGWHTNPEPYKQDELRVLSGHSTYKVPGKCIIRGEERDILATKRPIYENGEIVGLVGSFIDITDILKKETVERGENRIYGVKYLRRYPFFDKVLDEVSIDEVLDPLTGLISRSYFLEFAKSLIRDNTPFSFTMMDLDNFKQINDTHGHHAGDMTLSTISKNLMIYTKEFGIIGRFGGDEILIINFRDISYSENKIFFEDIYNNHGILRQLYTIEGFSLFITATAGCVSYPKDAEDFDTLFSLADKTLYHGKSIGRNCYTIYIKEKHENIDIQDLAKKGIYSNMSELMARLQSSESLEDKLSSIMGLLRVQLRITDLYYISPEHKIHSIMDQSLNEEVDDIAHIMPEEIYTDTTLDGIKDKCPKLYKLFSDLNKQSIMIVRTGLDNEDNGYLICAEPTQRIWQDDECALIYFIAKSVSAYIRLHHYPN